VVAPVPEHQPSSRRGKISLNWKAKMEKWTWWEEINTNVVKTIINHPFGNDLYHLFMGIWGMIYYCFIMFY
jgi:hypothetical protein